MPPRIPLSARQLQSPPRAYVCRQCRHASVVVATTPAAPIEAAIRNAPAATILRHASKQPPSHKPPEFRKSQLHRQYQSLLRASPLMLIFQHNNLKSTEFVSIRRELAAAMQKVDDELAKTGSSSSSSSSSDVLSGANVKLQVVQTGIFASALKVVEFWDPDFDNADASDPPPAASSAALEPVKKQDPANGLSRLAWRASKAAKKSHGLESLLSGPIAVVTVPTVSPQHLKAALSILAPDKTFPAPKRRTNPSYHEPAVQNGLQKLMLLGARIEGKAFDMEGARWVGGIQGGLEGLRGQLVAMLQGVGAGITSALSAASTNLYLTMESRKTMLEEDAKPKEEADKS